MLYRAESCGCEKEIGMSKTRVAQFCEHGNLLVYTRGLSRATAEKWAETAKGGPRRRSSLKRGKGFEASPAQRGKVAGLPCVNCGQEMFDYRKIDPAHVWPRGQGGCDDPLCVIPLCRTIDAGCHRLFDEGKLDLLAKLIDKGYYAELGHAIAAHELSPLTLLERTTGQHWEPRVLEGAV